MKPAERLAEGASAEILEYDDGTVLKLFRPEFAHIVEVEAQRAGAVAAAGLPVPEMRGVHRVGERVGILFERIDGPTMLEQVTAGELRVEEAGARLADLHVRLHRTRGVPGLPTRDQIADHLETRLPEREFGEWLARMIDVPDGDAVYHGDFHPGNVILSERGPVIVDWPNAALAHPSFDVARSVILMRYQGTPGVREDAARRDARELLTAAYLQRYLQAGAVTQRQVEAGMHTHAHGILRAGAFDPADAERVRAMAALVRR